MAFSFSNTGGGEKKTGTLFGSTTAPASGTFAQSQTNATGTGLFGSTAAPQNNSNSLFGSTQPQQSTGLFGQTQQQNAGSSLFGQPQPQQQQQNAGFSLFSQPQQQQQQQGQQQQQQTNMSNSLFGGSFQPAPILNNAQAQSIQQQREGLPQLRQSSAQPFAGSTMAGQREKSVVEQIRILNNKWDPENPECVFQYYFYNSVKPEEAPFYGPSQGEDERKWEEALSKKPSPGAIPVLARGFEQVGERIRQQAVAVTALRTRLHEINNSLSLLKDAHELTVASRITEAKRKHIVFTQRTLALATKVQILRNRGYVMDPQEEDLKKNLIELEKQTFDPVLGGRQEEIWARMSGVRERARILQEETEKMGRTIDQQQNGELLSEEDQKALEKLLKDYDRQLEHLKKWVDDTKEEYDEWETTKQSRPLKR
ncbi:Nucleoporin Nup44 [Pyrenophora tritici-repentis]|uniref:Nucleoporin Nup44 n=3 Tax=Pyrenophora tritici-repentis TaxID=45151 RepID=A0A922NN45_9PLEO|nr:nucleoporin Nup44 [Pyrenophora tritici-repentis Pt-1C-BFP]EDU46549.1 nucleoporin Nup44 [Pyrenophora tritici-repentis Pt-1C-BFP]KAI1517021.1 Nucleoporin Nup44 [Pyrenophora tritici-repentis]KAI1670423.1 Nucleoporin Nup44 [Pyrenophora tritici-repentis]KAI1682044.1 Nucleoporin Nup44 [Pyrenophora tritici-repentis]